MCSCSQAAKKLGEEAYVVPEPKTKPKSNDLNFNNVNKKFREVVPEEVVIVIAEVEAMQDHQDQEVRHLQVAQVEVAAVLPEVKEVVHRLNQEEEDKPVY